MIGPHGYRYENGSLVKADHYLNTGEIGYWPHVSKYTYAIIRIRKNSESCWEFVEIMDGPSAHSFIGDNFNSNENFIAIECSAPLIMKFEQLEYGGDKAIDTFYSWDLPKHV